MVAKSIKETVLENLQKVPDNASWEDMHYAIYVQESIAKGLNDIESGSVHTHDEIIKMFHVQ